MDFKTALKNTLKIAGMTIMCIIPFIAGIVAKENATNGFEVFIGWATMAIMVIIFIVAVRFKKKDVLNNNK